jgi:hypothetical protein
MIQPRLGSLFEPSPNDGAESGPEFAREKENDSGAQSSGLSPQPREFTRTALQPVTEPPSTGPESIAATEISQAVLSRVAAQDPPTPPAIFAAIAPPTSPKSESVAIQSPQLAAPVILRAPQALPPRIELAIPRTESYQPPSLAMPSISHNKSAAVQLNYEEDRSDAAVARRRPPVQPDFLSMAVRAESPAKPKAMQNLRRELQRMNSTAAPVIRVTIGRVEVRAVMPPQLAAAPQPETKRAPLLALDEYLKQRS